MKKYLIMICICLLLCGCGKKDTKKTAEVVKKSDIGSEDVSYSLDITCGDIKKNSNVTLNKDKTATYSLYECNNNNLELTYGEGVYEIEDSKVIITDNYSQKIEINVNGEKSIEISMGEIKQTLTK